MLRLFGDGRLQTDCTLGILITAPQVRNQTEYNRQYIHTRLASLLEPRSSSSDCLLRELLLFIYYFFSSHLPTHSWPHQVYKFPFIRHPRIGNLSALLIDIWSDVGRNRSQRERVTEKIRYILLWEFSTSSPIILNLFYFFFL